MPARSSDIRRGVLLFNLGGPETLEDVRPFLFNLFSDPEIIRIKNDAVRKLLAWFIAATRQLIQRGVIKRNESVVAAGERTTL